MALGRVLVVDDTKLITKIIHDKLAAVGFEVAEAYDGPEALKKLKSFSPNLIILDVMLPGMDGYQVARFVRQDPNHQHIPILMLTAKSGIQEKIAGFEAGADDYLTKPFDPTELELHVRALISRARTSRTSEEPVVARGKVITVFSLRGGSGTTLLAVNLAASLAQLFEQEVPLLDLSLETGAASIMLDLLPRRTLSHLAKEDFSAIDPALVREYLAPHSSGVRLLPAPTSPALAEGISPKLVNHLLLTLRASYPHLIVDTPHTLSELTLAALDVSDVILLIVPPDMISLKAATGALETLTSLGYAENRVTIVINYTFPRRWLPLKEIEAALGQPIRAVIPYEGDALAHAINVGIPPVTDSMTLAWSQAVEALAYQVASSEAKALADATGSKRLAALKKRVATSSLT